MGSDRFNAAPVYPIHHVPNRKATTRSAVREMMMETQDREKRERQVQARQDYVAAHPLVRGYEPKLTGNSTVDTLNQIKYQLAREAAGLEFTRIDRDQRLLDTSQLSKSIVATWRQVADIELDIKKQGITVLDPNSQEVQRILMVWMDAVKTTLVEMIKDDTVSTEVMDLFFSKFSAAFEGWQGRLD